MFKKYSTVYFITIVVFFLIFSLSFAGKFTEHRATRISPADIDQWEQNLDLNAVSGPSPIELAPTELGRTWYDYATNNVMGRMLAYSTNGIHFAFMKRQPNAAGNRYVTYDWWDLSLGIFYSNLSVTEAQATGWGRVVNGVNDEALIVMHGGGLWLYQDASEAGYSFSMINQPNAGGVFPGLARMGNNVVFMGQLANANWVGGDTILVSTDYMSSWTGYNIWPEEPTVTDYGVGEMWPEHDPTDASGNTWRVTYGPDITAFTANGEVKLATTTDNGASFTTEMIWYDDSLVVQGSNLAQYIIENFNQINNVYSQDGVYHVVFGAVQGVVDTSSTDIDMFPILYWNDRDRQMVELTDDFYGRPADPATQAAMADNRPGNGLGNAYPHIAEGPNPGELLVVWQQWEDNGAGGPVLLTPTGTGSGIDIFSTDIWGAYSTDGGQTWSDPFFVAGQPGQSDVYPNIPRNFVWNATSDSIYIDLLWMYDTNPSVSFNNFGTWSEATEVIWYYERIPVAAVPFGIEDDQNVVSEFRLAQNYPNPFNPTTTIAFEMQTAGKVTIEVFNTLGQKVATVINDRYTAGSHEVTFDASALSSGVYVYRMTTDNITMSRKMMLLK